MLNFHIWNQISKLIVDTKTFLKEKEFINFSIDETISKRSEIRYSLESITDNIRKAHNTKVAKYTSFAVAVWLDEILAEPYSHAQHPWPSLQQELFDTSEGGITIYEYLDEVILNPFYPHFIYELYYCMLKSGFKGKYVYDDKYVVATYLDKLESLLGYKENIQNNENMPVSQKPIYMLSKPQKILKKVKIFISRYYGLCMLSGLISVYAIFGLVLYI